MPADAPTAKATKARARLVGPVLIVLWVAALAAVYFVIVELKRGGVEGIRDQHRAEPPAHHAAP